MESGTVRLMAFSAHSADAADLAGGTLAKYAGNRHEVMVVMLSLGAKSHVMQKAPIEEMRSIKSQEAERAYSRLGVKHVRSLEYEEDPLVLGRQEIGDMVNLIREFRPTIVLTHHPAADNVPDHCETGRAVWHACHCSGRPGFGSTLPVFIVPERFFYAMAVSERGQLMTGSPAVLPSVFIDVSDVIDTKMEALGEFASQQYTEEFNRTRREHFEGHYGGEVGVGYAESFYNNKALVVDELPVSKGVPDFGRAVEGTEEG